MIATEPNSQNSRSHSFDICIHTTINDRNKTCYFSIGRVFSLLLLLFVVVVVMVFSCSLFLVLFSMMASCTSMCSVREREYVRSSPAITHYMFAAYKFSYCSSTYINTHTHSVHFFISSDGISLSPSHSFNIFLLPLSLLLRSHSTSLLLLIPLCFSATHTLSAYVCLCDILYSSDFLEFSL